MQMSHILEGALHIYLPTVIFNSVWKYQLKSVSENLDILDKN